MATAQDLMGLGESPFLAPRVANTPYSVTSSGASLASATQLQPYPGVAYTTASNSGSGLKLPNVGGANGCLLGDQIYLINLQAATVQVYASNSANIYITGASTAGATGVGIDPGFQVEFLCVTPSTWTAIKASA